MTSGPEALPESAERLVLALVGTDHHQFDRLVGWVDNWYRDTGSSPACLVQFGQSRPPSTAPGVPFLDHDHLQELVRSAWVVVCHGGPGVIMEVRKSGLRPLVVPRSPREGEHVDDHQQRFCRHLAGKGLIELVASEQALHAAIGRDLAAPARPERVAADAADAAGPAVRRFSALVEQLLERGTSRRPFRIGDRARRR